RRSSPRRRARQAPFELSVGRPIPTQSTPAHGAGDNIDNPPPGPGRRSRRRRRGFCFLELRSMPLLDVVLAAMLAWVPPLEHQHLEPPAVTEARYESI